jgi:hypothetical protein
MSYQIYNILLRQGIVLNIAPGIKFPEAAILTYLAQFSLAEKKIEQDGYTLIRYSKIVRDLPLLQVKNGSVGFKLKKLQRMGLVNFKNPKNPGDFENPQIKDNSVFFKILPPCDPLIVEMQKDKKGGRKGWLEMLIGAGITKARAEFFASNVKFMQDNFQRIVRGLSASSSGVDGRQKLLDQLYYDWDEQQKISGGNVY